MKHQQVVVDYWNMVKTSCTCLLLAFSGYILIKMVQTIFWLPGYLQNNQKRLEELAAQYSLDLHEEENNATKNLNNTQSTEELPGTSQETANQGVEDRHEATEAKKDK